MTSSYYIKVNCLVPNDILFFSLSSSTNPINLAYIVVLIVTLANTVQWLSHGLRLSSSTISAANFLRFLFILIHASKSICTFCYSPIIKSSYVQNQTQIVLWYIIYNIVYIHCIYIYWRYSPLDFKELALAIQNICHQRPDNDMSEGPKDVSLNGYSIIFRLHQPVSFPYGLDKHGLGSG